METYSSVLARRIAMDKVPGSPWACKELDMDTIDEATKWSEVKVTQSCPTLCYPMDYAVHGILQARILEWIAVPFSRGSSQLRDWTQVSCITGINSIVDLQCCVWFWCIAKWLSFTYVRICIYILFIFFSIRDYYKILNIVCCYCC